MASRIRIETSTDSLRVLMPSRNPWREYPTFARIIAALFFVVFVVATIFISFFFVPGLWSQLQTNFNSFSLACVLWSISFPLMLVYALYLLGRMRTGFEIAEFTQDGLTITKIEFGLSRTRTYPAQEIKNLEMYLIRGSMEERAFESMGFTKGALEFKYRNRRVRFGSSLDDAEAEYVLSAVGTQFPRYFKSKG